VKVRRVQVDRYRGYFKAVPLPAGSSVVKFSFLPLPFVCSLLAGWGCVLGVAFLWCLGLARGGKGEAERDTLLPAGQEGDC
jgi:hypothetical protein